MNLLDKKRILFIAAEFPPYKTIGRLRTVKLCLHLANLGWECYVLTIFDEHSLAYDKKTLAEIPKGTCVFRTKLWKPTESVILFVKKIFKIESRKNLIIKDDIILPNQLHVSDKNLKKTKSLKEKLGLIKGFYDKLMNRYMLIPDSSLGWLIPALNQGRKICNKYDIDLIFSTAPPFTDLLIGHFLKRMTGIKWVADYRDLWTGDVLREWVPRWRKKIEILLEKWTLSNADAILTVSEPKTAFIKSRINNIEKKKFYTITNGYDLEEFNGYEYKPNTTDKIRIVYTGRLFKNRRGYEIIRAIGEMQKENPDLIRKLKVEYYGGIAPEIRTTIVQMLQEFSLNDNFKFYFDISYNEVKVVQTNADILLLIVDTGETSAGVIPGKFFEYIAAKRPILCIAHPGATTKIVEKGKLGWNIPPGNISLLKKLLYTILRNKEELYYKPNLDYLNQFNRKQIIIRLNKILSDIIT